MIYGWIIVAGLLFFMLLFGIIGIIIDISIHGWRNSE